MDVLSPKPGNVSPNKEFPGATVQDFLKSAAAVAAVLSTAESRPPGRVILEAVQATRSIVSHNTNLGIILLLAPLAAVPRHQTLREGIVEVLRATTVADSEAAYEAIRLMNPGGLGDADAQDVADRPTQPLWKCMELAADRDLIARQYVSGFSDVLEQGVTWLMAAANRTSDQSEQVVLLSLQMLAHWGDSLIARKCGDEASRQTQQRARALLNKGWPESAEARPLLEDLDRFLRDEQHRRNPGTTADMVAATLFAAQRDGLYRAAPGWLNTEDT